MLLLIQAILFDKMRSATKKEIIKQRTDFNALLQSLGQASFAEIEKIMQEREIVEPEAGLSPEVVKRLKNKIAAKRKQSLEE